MTDAELATIMEALRDSKATLDAEPMGIGQRAAIEQLGVAIELMADIVYRMGKR